MLDKKGTMTNLEYNTLFIRDLKGGIVCCLINLPDKKNNTGFALSIPLLPGISDEERTKMKEIFIIAMRSFVKDYDDGKIEL